MKLRKFDIFLVVLAFASGLFFTSGSVEAHKYHTSLTRMDYNSRDKLIEITIQLFTHDLGPVLSKETKKKVDPEKTDETEQIIFDYLKDHFEIRTEKGEIQNFRWVGQEVKVDLVYVYLEIPFSGDLENLELKNTIFFENFPEQANFVVAYFNGGKGDLYFKNGDSVKKLLIKKNEQISK
ncbi:MAG: DUF6702 family protein [Pyrinomonadaceae bacterium]